MKKSTFIKLILVSSLSSCAMEHEPAEQPFPTQAAVPDTLHYDSIPQSYGVIHEVYHVHYINHYSYYGGYSSFSHYHYYHASQGQASRSIHNTARSAPRSSRSGFGTMAVSAVS